MRARLVVLAAAAAAAGCGGGSDGRLSHADLVKQADAICADAQSTTRRGVRRADVRFRLVPTIRPSARATATRTCVPPRSMPAIIDSKVAERRPEPARRTCPTCPAWLSH